MIYKKGEVWDVADRHGNMTIKLLEEVDTKKDMFFDAEIIKGKKDYISRDSQDAQKHGRKGTTGIISSFRTGLCRFRKEMKK